MRRGLRLSAAIATLLVAGCSSEPVISADGAAFAGLDGATVDEVLASADAMGRVEGWPDESARLSVAQGVVRNFILCRDVAGAYSEWMVTGIAPETPALPVPDEPLEPSHGDWEVVYADLVSRFESGDPNEVRMWLTGETGCATWVPVSDTNDEPLVTTLP